MVKNYPGNVCIITHHPFWLEPLGCGTVIRARYELLKKICKNVDVLFITKSKLNCPLPGGTLNLTSSISENEVSSIQDFIKSQKISSCYFSYDQFGFLTEFTNCRNVVEILDVMHLRETQFNKFGFDAPYKIGKADEIKSLQRYDSVLSLNINEVEYLKANGITTARYLPPNLDFNNKFASTKIGTFGLIASMAKPNLDGFNCLNFALRHSDKFTLAGPISTYDEVISKLGPLSRKLGIVESPSSFYSEIEVALSPVRFGGGLKIKVFEALSFGKPVLATQHSIDGFPKGIKDVVSVIDDIATWNIDSIKIASEIPSSLIKDFFISNFSEEICMDTLLEVL